MNLTHERDVVIDLISPSSVVSPIGTKRKFDLNEERLRVKHFVFLRAEYQKIDPFVVVD